MLDVQVNMEFQMNIEFELATELELDRMFSWHEYVLFNWTWVCTPAETGDRKFTARYLRGYL
jgi:hypothetical protein